MQDYAEKEGLLCPPRKMLISSYFLENGTVITPLLLFYLELGLVCIKIYRFVEDTPVKCFNKFVQSAVDSRRERDENPNSSVVAETMKLLANSSYGYQILDRSRHTVTKYLNDEKTHGAINTKFFKRLDNTNDQLYEVELVKAEIEHQSLLGFSYSNTLFFSRDSVTSTNLGSWKTTLTLCIWLCLKKSCTIAFEKNLKLIGAYSEQKIAKMISQLRQQPTSFLEPAAQNI